MRRNKPIKRQKKEVNQVVKYRVEEEQSLVKKLNIMEEISLSNELTSSAKFLLTEALEEVGEQLSKVKWITGVNEARRKPPAKPKSTITIEIPDFIADRLTSTAGYTDYYLISTAVLILSEEDVERLPQLPSGHFPDITKVVCADEGSVESLDFEGHYSDRGSYYFTFSLSEMNGLEDLNAVLKYEVVGIKKRMDGYLRKYGIEKYRLEIGLWEYEIC